MGSSDPKPPPSAKTKRRKKNRKSSKGKTGKVWKATDGLTKLPQKRFYRQRAHANPFSDHFLE